MKEGFARRLRSRFLGRREPRADRPRRGAKREREVVIEELAAEFTTEELQEFLEADRYPIEADPLFKEQLREQIWKLLQRNIQDASGDN